MQKVYLLLRNNRQSGPYTLEELLRLSLQPKDLVWAEGRSAGWCYPHEMETLRPFLSGQHIPAAPAAEAPKKETAGKHVFVSLPQSRMAAAEPAPGFEEKAEALRRRALETADTVQTHYSRSLDEVQASYTSWMYRQHAKKKKRIRPLYYTAAAIILTGLAGGWWLGTAWEDKKELALPVKALRQTAGKEAGSLVQASPLEQPVAQEQDVTVKPVTRPEGKRALPKEKPSVPLQERTAATAETLPPAGDTAVIPEATLPEVAAVPGEAPRKKKSLKEAIGGFFKKLGGRDDASNKSERAAEKREEQPADLSGQVSIGMNRSGGDWMMGVQGLTLTLRNNSAYTLASALVEVRYYSEDKTLLEKKTVRFGKIAAGKSATLPAPDHRMADHADCALLSAEGNGEAYARQ